MTSDQVTQINIAGNRTGIIGLKAALYEISREMADRPDREIGEALLKRLAQRNYIPDRAKPAYREALLREFNRSVGKPVNKCLQHSADHMSIKLLGPGCPNCDRIEQEIIEVLSELNLVADFEHVRDLLEIGHYGVMGTPALVINEKVITSGSVPPKAQLKIWIERAASTHGD